MSSVQHSEENRFAEMRAEFPDSESAELLRFCRARPDSVADACQMYRSYLEWRQDTGSTQNLSDAANAIPTKLFRHCGQALDGSPLLLVEGARYDANIEPEKYVLACAHAVDSRLSSDDDRKLTVLIDVRPGEGWNNPPALKMLPFFRSCADVLSNNYPERVQRVVIYPVPSLVGHLWRMVRSMLDPVTRGKIQVHNGSAALGAPCPSELRQVVELSQLPIDAQQRHQALAEQ